MSTAAKRSAGQLSRAARHTRGRGQGGLLASVLQAASVKPWLAPRRLEPEAEASRQLGAVHRGCSGSSWRSSLLILHDRHGAKPQIAPPLMAPGSTSPPLTYASSRQNGSFSRHWKKNRVSQVNKPGSRESRPSTGRDCESPVASTQRFMHSSWTTRTSSSFPRATRTRRRRY